MAQPQQQQQQRPQITELMQDGSPQSSAEIVGLCLASGWMSLKTTLRTAPLFRIKVLLMAEKENLDAGYLIKPYNGILGCFQSVKENEGLSSLWHGCQIGVLQSFLSHLTNIPLFYGWMPFGFLHSLGLLVDPYLHGVLYAMCWDFIFYPVELAYLCIAADIKQTPGAPPADTSGSNGPSLATSTTKAEERVPQGLVPKAKYEYEGLLHFLQTTFDAQGLSGLFNGYLFAFGRMLVRLLGYGILKMPFFQEHQGIGLALSIALGVVAHTNHVLHTRYVVRGRAGSPLPPYKGVVQCFQAIQREGTTALLCGLPWAIIAAIIDQMVQGVFEGLGEALQ